MGRSLVIECLLPSFCHSEIQHTVSYVMGRLFDCNVSFGQSKNEKITISVDGEKKLVLNAVFFQKADKKWLDACTLPRDIQFYRNVHNPEDSESALPVLYGIPEVVLSNDVIEVEVDILGSVFFMLSRYEECVDGANLDEHGRFQATSSIAYKNNFLNRPIVDEYINLLGSLMKELWPHLQEKKRTFNKFVTCDVDWPFDPIRRSFFLTVKGALSKLIRGKSMVQSAQLIKHYFKHKLSLPDVDSCRDNVYWIMEENEKLGRKVAFYFITELTNDSFESKYDFDSREMRELFKDIAERGHEIGLHPGYNCMIDPDLFYRSTLTLKRILQEERIEQDVLGGRMHFLRWDSRTTPKLWDECGFDYDSSLAYAELSGFRCGTCHPFPMYDVMNRQPLRLIQRPLINMECTVISPKYEGFGYTDQTLERFNSFIEKVKAYNGEYVLLWHNTHFDHQVDRSIYKEIIK